MYQKRQLAAQSGLFNLKDPTFTELFPDTVQVRIAVMIVHKDNTFHHTLIALLHYLGNSEIQIC